MLDATVSSLTGAASSPPRTNKPSAPTEKSPLTALTPECMPVTDCTSKPVADLGQHLVGAQLARAAAARPGSPRPARS